MTDTAKKSDFFQNIRGKLTENAPLGPVSWFRCGGSADLLFQPADFDDLTDFLKQYPKDEPLTVLGGVVNTIVRDGGVRGCVIRLGRAFAGIEVQGTNMAVGTGALNGTVAQTAAKAGIGGLEFLSGIPGTIGGALRMNAGSYGSEVKDILVECTSLDRLGCLRKHRLSGMEFGYRSCGLPKDYIFTHAVFAGREEDPETLRKCIKDMKARRRETQPITEKTGGSTFANPEGHKAWELIDKAGGRGLKIGGAQMSDKHCNFMINTGSATASDLEALGEEIRKRVRKKTGIELRWEIKRIGEA